MQIYVRRAGPNYQEGLRVMRETGLPLMPFLIEKLFQALMPIVLPRKHDSFTTIKVLMVELYSHIYMCMSACNAVTFFGYNYGFIEVNSMKPHIRILYIHVL